MSSAEMINTAGLKRLVDRATTEDVSSYSYDGKEYYEIAFGLRWLWSTGSLDGPMQGIVFSTYSQSFFYAKCWQNPHTRAERWFWLYPITNDEFVICLEKHHAWLKRKTCSYGVYSLFLDREAAGFAAMSSMNYEEQKQSLNAVQCVVGRRGFFKILLSKILGWF